MTDKQKENLKIRVQRDLHRQHKKNFEEKMSRPVTWETFYRLNPHLLSHSKPSTKSNPVPCTSTSRENAHIEMEK